MTDVLAISLPSGVAYRWQTIARLPNDGIEIQKNPECLTSPMRLGKRAHQTTTGRHTRRQVVAPDSNDGSHLTAVPACGERKALSR